MNARYDYETEVYRRDFYLAYPEHVLNMERNQSLVITCKNLTENLPLTWDKYLASEIALENVERYYIGKVKTIATDPNISVEDVEKILNYGINVIIHRIDNHVSSTIENDDFKGLNHLFHLVDMAAKNGSQVVTLYSRAGLGKTMKMVRRGLKISLSYRGLRELNNTIYRMSNDQIERIYPAICQAEVFLPFYYGTPRQQFLKDLFPIRETYTVENILSSVTQLPPEILNTCIDRLGSSQREVTLSIDSHPSTSSYLIQAGYTVQFSITNVTLTPNNYYRIGKRLRGDFEEDVLMIMFREACKCKYLFLLETIKCIFEQRNPNCLRLLLKETLEDKARYIPFEYFKGITIPLTEILALKNLKVEELAFLIAQGTITMDVDISRAALTSRQKAELVSLVNFYQSN